MTPLYVSVALFISFGSYAVSGKTAELPSYVKTCKRDTPNTNDCLLNAVKDFVPHLVKGIPELDIPPMDPLSVNETVVEYRAGVVGALFTMKDYLLYGIGDIILHQVGVNLKDLDNFKLEIAATIPKVRITGSFQIQGKFLKTDLKGNGQFNVSLSNVKGTFVFGGSKEIIDGVTFVGIQIVDVQPVVSDMKVDATDLIQGNPRLSKTVLKLVNKDWQHVYKEIAPFIRIEANRIISDIANRVFKTVPFDKIFPAS